MPLDTLLSRHARYRPEHTALVFEDERLTFAELDERVSRVASALTGLGLAKGDKVATVLENCVEVIELYHAAARTGLVVVPLSPLLRGTGLTNLVNDSDARVLITNAALAPEIDRLRAELPGIPADPVAAVTLRAGETSDAEAIRDWVNERVEARFQKLSSVVVLDEFPRNAAGKTLRRELRETYSRQEAGS
jgi:acyl-CoA synthetase (AMP-forming)/AMP-acid ligase II